MSEKENLVHLNDENFAEQTKSGLVLVDFHATWCGPCRMIAPVVEQLADQAKDKAKIAKVDIDQAQSITADLQISSVPTLILFKDGEEVKRVVGVKDFDYLLDLIESHS